MYARTCFYSTYTCMLSIHARVVKYACCCILMHIVYVCTCCACTHILLHIHAFMLIYTCISIYTYILVNSVNLIFSMKVWLQLESCIFNLAEMNFSYLISILVLPTVANMQTLSENLKILLSFRNRI